MKFQKIVTTIKYAYEIIISNLNFHVNIVFIKMKR